VSVHQDLLALKPDNVTFEQAASVPTSGLIALQNLRGLSQWRPGQKVLVNGAGGGVGALALQMMKAHGAHATAVDSTGKLGMLRSLGADEVVDYTREAIAVLRELLESGKVTPIIDSTFQLSEVREAFRRMIEDEIQGKVIITPAERV